MRTGRRGSEPGGAAPPHNLPLQPTELLGRDQELDVARQLLLHGGVRLLTLTGPAGVGKTRLALGVAAELLAHFPHGVWFVDLSAVRESELLAAAIARTPGVGRNHCPPLAGGEDPRADLGLLLVLDNFEQVLPAATQVADLLARCRGVTVLVTSRTRLRLRWEHVLPVAPLACPEPGARLTPEAAAAAPAVALFVERARASRPGFALTPENLPAVVALCQRLEGMPLAIEMAAARASALAPSEIAAWIEQRSTALSWAAPDAPSRQHTLRHGPAWGYSRLPAPEQALLRRLAVFVGGCSLEAAASVAEAEALGLAPQAGLAALVDASLLQVDQSARGESRFGLLGILRQFASEELAARGELEETRRRHALEFLALAEAAAPELERGPDARRWFDRLERERDNLRAALAWAAEHGQAELEMRLARSLAPFWRRCGRLAEGRDWLADALRRGQDAPAALRLDALQAAGLLAALTGDLGPATEQLEEALTLARALGDGRGVLQALGGLLHADVLRGQPRRALARRPAVAAVRRGADPRCLSAALHCLGLAAHDAGQYGAGAAYLEEALALSRAAGDRCAAAYRLGALAAVAHARGDHTRSAGLAAESLALAREQADPRAIAWCARMAAPVARHLVPAEPLARMLAAAGALATSPPLSPAQRARLDEVVAAARSTLGETAFAAAWAEGCATPPDQLVDVLLAGLEARSAASGEARPVAARPRRGAGQLSPREGEVLRLVADGLTNRQIADRLVISVATVNYHVGWVLTKLAVVNRAQAVAVAAHRGLL